MPPQASKKDASTQEPPREGGEDDKPDKPVLTKTSNRPYSIVVWGATGFTGSLVCKHIAQNYPGQFKWALAGRSSEKLGKLREELAAIDPACKSVPILTADLSDNKSLDKLVKQSDVLVSTAGPYWKLGMPLVEASLRNGTHYCDIAGEVHFMRRTVTTLHDAAVAKNVKVVHSCGFDSVPSDLGARMLVEHMRDTLGRPAGRVALLVNDIKGGQSGGSLASMFEQYLLPQDEIALCGDPFCLNPPPRGGEPPRRAPAKFETDQFGMRYDQALSRWTYPFQFAAINSRVVRRSAAFLGYGPAFRYSEAREAEGPVDAMLGAFGHSVVHLFTTVPFLRALVTPLLPKPGDGPPEAFRERNHWKFTLHGWTDEAGKARARTCQAVVQGRRDPGYLETSRIVLEAALCLALQDGELRERGYMQAGVLTPAASMGAVLLARLRDASITFEITKAGTETPTGPLDKLKAAGTAGAAGRSAAASGLGRSAASIARAPALSPLRHCLRGGTSVASPGAPALQALRPQRLCRVHGRGALGNGFAHVHPVARIAYRACRHGGGVAHRCLRGCGVGAGAQRWWWRARGWLDAEAERLRCSTARMVAGEAGVRLGGRMTGAETNHVLVRLQR